MSRGYMSEPILTPIQIKTKNVRRLGHFGQYDDSFDTIIEKMLDYFDGVLNKNAVTLPKQSERQSPQYRDLYLQ